MAEPNEEQKKKEQDKQDKKERDTVADGKAAAAAIAKAVAGLKFRASKGVPVMDDTTGKPVMEGGKPKLRFVPDWRTMTADDVLSAALDGGELVIVSKDGMKHRVSL